MATKAASRNGIRATRQADDESDLTVNHNEDGEEVITSAVYRPEVITFRIIGISPLLQNNPASFVGKDETVALVTKKTYDDQEEARLRCYLDPDGRHYRHPSQSVVKSIIKAVTGKKFNKVSAPGLIRGNVFITEDWSILEDEKGNPLGKTDYTIDRQPVVMPNKARVLRCRPKWWPWCIRIALELNTALITAEHVREALTIAGPTVGIGDFRPEKGGRHGRFKVG